MLIDREGRDALLSFKTDLKVRAGVEVTYKLAAMILSIFGFEVLKGTEAQPSYNAQDLIVLTRAMYVADYVAKKEHLAISGLYELAKDLKDFEKEGRYNSEDILKPYEITQKKDCIYIKMKWNEENTYFIYKNDWGRVYEEK